MLFKNISKRIMSICASGRGFIVFAVIMNENFCHDLIYFAVWLIFFAHLQDRWSSGREQLAPVCYHSRNQQGRSCTHSVPLDPGMSLRCSGWPRGFQGGSSGPVGSGTHRGLICSGQGGNSSPHHSQPLDRCWRSPSNTGPGYSWCSHWGLGRTGKMHVISMWFPWQLLYHSSYNRILITKL